MTENTSLEKPIKLGIARKGIAANKQNYDQRMKDVDPKTVTNRLGLVIDDSGSMGRDGMEKAHEAVKGFCNNCNNMDTSITVFPLNAENKPLTCDYDLVTMYVNGLWATGGTPIFKTLKVLITDQSITRTVLFSDGEPTDGSLTKEQINYWENLPGDWKKQTLEIIKMYTDKEIPIDTIFIGIKDSQGYKEMEKIAELTKGTFLHFTDASVLSKSLKYLAPKYRALLSNPDIKARVERGETI